MKNPFKQECASCGIVLSNKLNNKKMALTWCKGPPWFEIGHAEQFLCEKCANIILTWIANQNASTTEKESVTIDVS